MRQDLNRFETFLQGERPAHQPGKTSRISEVPPTTSPRNKGTDRFSVFRRQQSTRRLSVISAYYEWHRVNSDGTVHNPVERVKASQGPERETADLSMITSWRPWIEGITDVRDKAIVLLFLYTGLRLAELEQLDKTTITLRRKKLPDGSFPVLWRWRDYRKGKQETFIPRRTESDGGVGSLHRPGSDER